ncbi:MAG TPA: fused MFS/spermidine synthase [Verrucomicrobiae bacterium]|nr:fused MFS/spermidine synthase [Verrucomicrobiae bacterium]
MVLLLFFCSGATALVYEVVWSKYLSLMFGSTIQAQTVVLAVFMGGLALGNRIVGSRADLLRHPLAAYGYLELAIGLYAFLFSWIYRLADWLFVAAGSRLLDHGSWLLLLKAVLSVGLLLGPTILMGGTLPLLAAWLQKQSNDAGRLSARFYSVNSLGAVFGSALAGFFLVRALGMVATLQLTALANILVGFAAVGLSRRHAAIPSVTADNPSPGETPDTKSAALRWGAMLVALTGAVSMGLEVLASRSLALIFGSSLQAFAIVLMAFILGIGLGSAVVASPRMRRWQEEKTLFALLLSAAAVIGVLVAGIEQWVDIYRHVRTGLARSEMGFVFHQLAAGAIAMVVLGLPAALLGAVLPVCIRAEGIGAAGLGERVGRLLTWNTVGAVVGVLVTGFVLMPRIGLRGAFGVLAVILCLASLALALRTHQRFAAGTSVALAVLLIGEWTAGGEGWRHVLSSGVFRARETAVNPHTLSLRKKHIKLLFYEDAADATVTVEEGDGVAASTDRGLRINGKPDASTRGDMSTQLMVAHLPLLVRPHSTDVFMLGFGSGISAGALLGHPVQRVVVAENCEPVLRAGHLFAQWNRGALTNPVVRLWNEDARTILKLSPRQYDIVICQPSNPWMIGVGSVFSREFYELGASRLKEGGILCQWFHVYEMSDEIVGLVFRSFTSVFPHVEVWDAGPGDVILLGSKQPWKSSPDVFREAFNRPEPRKDFASIGLGSPEALWALQLASQRTGFAMAGEGPVQSDAFPILEYEAPRAFYIGASSVMPVIFDERTWQMDLAPADKRSTLAALNVAGLAEFLDRFGSVNDQFKQYVALLIQNGKSSDDAVLRSADGMVPCIFAPTNFFTAKAVFPAKASDSFKRAFVAEMALRAQMPDWQDRIATIEELLRGLAAGPAAASSDWSPAKAAAVAVKACLNHGDRARAERVLAQGLRAAPGSPELLYLARILEREKHGE